jgi:hypothetical protein
MRRLCPLLFGSFLFALLPLLGATPGTNRHISAYATAQRAGTHLSYLPFIADVKAISPFGVVMYGDVSPTAGLTHMQAAGSKHVTTMVDWAAIEPAEGVYNWTHLDEKVRHARTAGLEVFALFIGDPAWAWLPDRSATVPQKRLNFVRVLVDRYDCDNVNDAGPGLCIHSWSFYAEPDYYRSAYDFTPGRKGYWGKRGQQYAHMIAEVSAVIRQQDPSAQVMIGGLGYDWFEDQGGPFVRSFLSDVLRELNRIQGSAAVSIDAIAVHYYPLNFARIRTKLLEIQSIMKTHGVEGLPIIVPEAGYWSSASHGSSDQQQAQRLIQIYTDALSVGAQYVSWFNVFDNGAGTEAVGLFYGRDLNKPKPAYFAYQTLTRQLQDASYMKPWEQPGVSGHIFRLPNGHEKTVIWSTTSSAHASFSLTCAHIVTTTGTSIGPITDGMPGWDHDQARNGSIRLAVPSNEAWFVTTC